VNLRLALDTYRGHTVPHFRIIDHRRFWFGFSGILILLSLIGFGVRGLQYSIDFRGGAQITYPLEREVSVPEVTALLAEQGFEEANIQIVNGNEISIRTESITAEGRNADQVLDSLAEQAGVERADVSVEDVGPTWGAQISRKAIQGFVIVLALILLYITWRFEWAMALSGIVALLHDIVITLGIYTLLGRSVAPETVIALLTIMGFSLYDTVVIFDKVQENLESPALMASHGYDGVVNLSLNTVLMRSVNTSLVTLLPITAMLLYGGETLKDFAFAMFIGTAAGTYSSIFTAAPLLTVLKGRDEKVRLAEQRRRAREARQTTPARAATHAPTGDGDAVARGATAAAAPAASGTGGGTGRSRGRPRPKSKKRPPAKRRRR
jgi:preprotein translocase subunit SecF